MHGKSAMAKASGPLVMKTCASRTCAAQCFGSTRKEHGMPPQANYGMVQAAQTRKVGDLCLLHLCRRPSSGGPCSPSIRPALLGQPSAAAGSRTAGNRSGDQNDSSTACSRFEESTGCLSPIEAGSSTDGTANGAAWWSTLCCGAHQGHAAA